MSSPMSVSRMIFCRVAAGPGLCAEMLRHGAARTTRTIKLSAYFMLRRDFVTVQPPAGLWKWTHESCCGPQYAGFNLFLVPSHVGQLTCAWEHTRGRFSMPTPSSCTCVLPT